MLGSGDFKIFFDYLFIILEYFCFKFYLILYIVLIKKHLNCAKIIDYPCLFFFLFNKIFIYHIKVIFLCINY